MKNEKCALVKELVPLYIEEITSQEATEIIEEHIKTCTLCREFYNYGTYCVLLSCYCFYV